MTTAARPATVPRRRAGAFTLANGMDAVVIPDHRAPVVTHMVWYRVGAADGPGDISGVAHFLEHLMFKSTGKLPDGAFASIVMQLGGQLNAFTNQDVTAYHQRISRNHLGKMMEMEADRMVDLRLTHEEVATERKVIIEERILRYDNDPGARLREQMNAALYLAHPYGTPGIGWAHDIARLSRQDALTFYKRYYAPNNAVLVVAGDVTPEEVKQLAEETYGNIPANADVEARARPQEPPHEAARRLTMRDKRAGNASFRRVYLAPSYVTAAPGEAEAIEILLNILGDGATGRLYRKLVVEDETATAAGGGFFGSGCDSGTIGLHAVAARGHVDSVEAAIDHVIEEIRNDGVTELELQRAKRSLMANFTYDSDDQEKLARRYGMAVAVGRTIDEVEAWPQAIAKVTAAGVKVVANSCLDARRSVTGWLLPEDETARSISQSAGHSRARTR